MLRKLVFVPVLCVLVVFAGCNGSGGDDSPMEPEEPLAPGEIANYTRVDHQGFVIHVQNSALANNGTITNQALDKVKADLNAIVNDYDLKSAALDSLRNMTFFIDWSTSVGGTAQFHVSHNWLINNGYIPEKLHSVEVSNVGNFLFHTGLNMPNLLLHEIAHLYHITTLTVNHDPIYQAFVNARDSNLYIGVSYNAGNDRIVEGVASPAMSDQMNYFAELTEAYFGQNDYYPFNREQLREHDPLGYSVIEAAWKD